MDIKLTLPQTVINFIMKNIAGMFLYVLQQQSLKVSPLPFFLPQCLSSAHFLTARPPLIQTMCTWSPSVRSPNSTWTSCWPMYVPIASTRAGNKWRWLCWESWDYRKRELTIPKPTSTRHCSPSLDPTMPSTSCSLMK
jgi:hypothetical protein